MKIDQMKNIRETLQQVSMGSSNIHAPRRCSLLLAVMWGTGLDKKIVELVVSSYFVQLAGDFAFLQPHRLLICPSRGKSGSFVKYNFFFPAFNCLPLNIIMDNKSEI